MMKKIVFLAASIFFFACTLNAQKLKTKTDSVSYALGVTLGAQLKISQIKSEDLNLKLLTKGIELQLNEKDLKISAEDCHTIVMDFFMAAKDEANSAEKEVMLAKEKAFLEENIKREGVKTTESGLQYEILVEGTGAIPGPTDKVKVHYTGTLLDGTVFDSSVERGEPIVFGVNQVIKGWTEALQLMKEGAKWKLFIPHDLAYGARGAGQLIKPYSTLIFEVELISIEK